MLITRGTFYNTNYYNIKTKFSANVIIFIVTKNKTFNNYEVIKKIRT